MKQYFYLAVVFVTVFACKKETEQKPIEEISMPAGINVSLMDTTVRPQDDFYNFVNGNWMKNTEIPSDRGRWGSFDQLREYTDSISLKLLNKTLTETHEAGTDSQKVADLFNSIMDTVARDNAGIDPLKKDLDAIEKIASLDDVQTYLEKQTAKGQNPLYSFYVRPHTKNSNKNAVYLGGPSLGMSRDYYHKNDKESTAKLMAYQNYLKNIFGYIGDENAEKSAQETLELEKKLASEIWKFEQLRDANLQYNPVATADLANLTNAVDFNKYFDFLGVKTDTVIIREINYYKNLSKVLTEQNLDKIKKYLKADLVNGNAQYLNSDLEQMHFDFYEKELKGIDEMRARDKRALGTVNSTIGQAFGKVYVAEYFPAEAKEKAEEMVRYVRKAFQDHINSNTWMTDSTKVKALAKLEKFNVKIGYPDQWKDYSGLTIKSPKDGGSFYENMKNIAAWQFQENLDKIGKDVDKSEWFMPPQMVNAYYSPSFNEIVFPAAILQPPFYNFKADAAVNFGGMGAVIGHEISHGFDDSGAKFDGDGNLNNWWSDTDKEQFSVLGDALVEQYNLYEPLEGVFVNGRSTLGENIADLGGVNVAYDGLQLYLKDKGSPDNMDGFTPDQRFFISWATIWRTKSKDEALRNQVKTDFHSPGYFRAIGPLENIDAFYNAFHVKEADKMYKPEDQRIKIW
ncbi:M13 family peptidase [Weeksellaceae bacterium KMM 9724]|uniref:M13 family metallopeptidase n=1 Tax=Profundicola chukchiensis TaxID=2961959 RepID=UPI002439BF39|nr:M13-type metalloendopeptidase [Profundicola chukchiensis]MDG4951043.1 M13 family peptidase [Profundicola chukchiensis]